MNFIVVSKNWWLFLKQWLIDLYPTHLYATGLGIRYNRCSLSKTGRNPSIEVGERALLVKSMQCKQENLSLSLRTHLKVEQSDKHLKSPFWGRERQEDHQGLLASQPDPVNEFWVHWETLFPKKNVDSAWRTMSGLLASMQMCSWNLAMRNHA